MVLSARIMLGGGAGNAKICPTTRVNLRGKSRGRRFWGGASSMHLIPAHGHGRRSRGGSAPGCRRWAREATKRGARASVIPRPASQGCTIPGESAGIAYYTYYIILGINTEGIIPELWFDFVKYNIYFPATISTPSHATQPLPCSVPKSCNTPCRSSRAPVGAAPADGAARRRCAT